MRQQLVDRRTVLTATTALTAASLLPRTAFAQPAPASLAGARRIRRARRARAVDGRQDRRLGRAATCTCATAPSSRWRPASTRRARRRIDGKGMICMPGFVDTHWHHWTSFLRPVMRTDDPKRTYFPVTAALGLHYTPDDSYKSARLSLAEALTAGVTTTHNWAHNVRSPAHADAEVRAMRESGLRGRFAYGPALGMPNDKPMDLADMARLKRDVGKDTMLTVGMCSRNIDGNNTARGAIDAAMATKEWSGAREIGLPITLHTNGSASIQLLDGANLLGKDVQLVHPLEPGREGFRHAGQARRALQRVAAGRSRSFRRDAVCRADAERRAGEPVDRQRHRRALRLLCLHAHDADRQQAPQRRQIQAADQAPGGNRHHRRRPRSRLRRRHRLAHAGQARRPDPRPHRGAQYRADRRSL